MVCQSILQSLRLEASFSPCFYGILQSLRLEASFSPCLYGILQSFTKIKPIVQSLHVMKVTACKNKLRSKGSIRHPSVTHVIGILQLLFVRHPSVLHLNKANKRDKAHKTESSHKAFFSHIISILQPLLVWQQVKANACIAYLRVHCRDNGFAADWLGYLCPCFENLYLWNIFFISNLYLFGQNKIFRQRIPTIICFEKVGTNWLSKMNLMDRNNRFASYLILKQLCWIPNQLIK